MSYDYTQINDYLVDIFNNAMIIEESNLKASLEFSDVTLKEMHTLDVIGKLENPTVSEIARTLMITNSTVTICLNNLERKGYVKRKRSTDDARVVNLSMTKKGQEVNEYHTKFHQRMVDFIIKDLSKEDTSSLVRALEKLHTFLLEVKNGK